MQGTNGTWATRGVITHLSGSGRGLLPHRSAPEGPQGLERCRAEQESGSPTEQGGHRSELQQVRDLDHAPTNACGMRKEPRELGGLCGRFLEQEPPPKRGRVERDGRCVYPSWRCGGKTQEGLVWASIRSGGSPLDCQRFLSSRSRQRTALSSKEKKGTLCVILWHGQRRRLAAQLMTSWVVCGVGPHGITKRECLGALLHRGREQTLSR
jgi:hypothetical protein